MIKVKVVMDKKRNKVLFVESDSDFVDLLFHILSLPLRTLAEHLSLNTLPGSLDKLHQSFQNLEHRHFIDPTKQPAANYQSMFATSRSTSPFDTSDDDDSSCEDYDDGPFGRRDSFYFAAASCSTRQIPPPQATTTTFDLSSPTPRYVKGSAKYMVTDDLRVSALDAGSIVDAVKSCAHPDDLEYKVVDFGSSAEARELLKATLQSEATLTSVFLKPAPVN